MPDYEAVIGLETHIQLNTTSKIFCGCKADSWYDPPNSNICPVCCGLPGVLPVLNERVVEKAVLLAAAMHSNLRPVSYFDRKNYFYPDLPKGYQISQYDMSLASGGFLDLPVPPNLDSAGQGYIRHVSITKLHIEEDAGKTKNAGGERFIDFNRCGVPLVEMVTGPDLHTADEAAQYLIRLRQLLRWLGISEADMEKGHLRCDANVSIRPVGATYLNPKTEIKNVNSIDAVRDAIEKEVERQIRETEAGRRIQAWTLEWDEDAGVLKKMRSKETEDDYRYFREPDLLPIRLTEDWKQAILQDLPELPLERRVRFIAQYGLPEYDAEILTQERRLSDYFETAVKAYARDSAGVLRDSTGVLRDSAGVLRDSTGVLRDSAGVLRDAKKVSNWLMNDILRMLNDGGLTADQLKLTPGYLAEILKLVDSGAINSSTGKTLLGKVQESGKTPAQIVEGEGLARVSDDAAIRAVVEQVLAESPNEAAAYRGGKVTLMGWFVGQVMKKMRGKADPQLARQMLEKLLG